MKLVFFGTSELGAIILEKMVRVGMVPVLVITAPDMPAGRKQLLTPPPVKSCIMKHETWNIPIVQPTKLDSSFTLQVSRFKPDLIVLAAYGRIIPKEILDMPKYGALNVHPSLLPKYRGPSPVQYAVLEGEETTGVSILLMDEEIDHGPILTNDKIQITNDKITYPELHNQLAELGGDLLVKTLPQWLQGKIIPKEQDHSKATFTRKITKEEGRIDWNKEAEYIERQVRAFYPWPGTFATLKIKNQKAKSKITDQNLKILKADVLKNIQGETGKTFQTTDGKLAVYTGEDALLIEELQLEGGKPMSSKEFLLGHKGFLGNILE